MVTLRQIDDYRWEIPREGKMRTRGLIFCSREMLPDVQGDQSLQQVANVATLPGIVGPSLAMPDIHWGYGFAIGGVAAFNLDQGIISPGGVGYDINCGVRLLRTKLHRDQVQPRMEELVNILFGNIPSGVGSRRKDLKLTAANLKKVLLDGCRWGLRKVTVPPRTWSTSRPGAASTAPTPTWCPSLPWIGARTSWAPWVPATISWKWGRSWKSTMPR